MGGLIIFSKEGQRFWRAATTRFEWVLSIIQRHTADEELVDHIGEIIDNHLQALWIEDLTDSQRDELFRILRDDLYPEIADAIPEEASYRTGSLRNIARLVQLVPPASEEDSRQD